MPYEHTHCVLCGTLIQGASALCLHHHAIDDGWGRSNKIWSDFFHRGVPIARIDDFDRDDDQETAWRD